MQAFLDKIFVGYNFSLDKISSLLSDKVIVKKHLIDVDEERTRV